MGVRNCLPRFIQKLLSRILSPERRVAVRHADGSRVELEMALQTFEGKVVDVSETGARLTSRNPIHVGRSVLVRVPREGGCSHLVLVVRWVTRREGVYVFGATPDPNYGFSAGLLRNYAKAFCYGDRYKYAA